MKTPIISVVVCTYNGETLLPGCLASLVEQTADKDSFEVIIVNNNSTDGSLKVAEEFAKGLPNFRVVNEEKIGLSNARNRGFKEAAGRYVSYLDDDAKATKNWVEEALKIIADKKPELFGGPIHPFYEEEPQPWMKDIYNSYSMYEDSCYLGKDQYLSGSNIFILRELLETYGGFDPELGMKGDYAGYHEETALQLRARDEGRKIYYDKRLLVLHLVPNNKQTILYYLYSNYKSGKDGKYLWNAKYSYGELLELFKELDVFFSGIETAVKSRDINAYPYPENYVIEKLAPSLFVIGSKLEYFSKHQAVELEEFLKYFVKNKQMTLSEYLKIYKTLSPYKFDFPAVMYAYNEVTGQKTGQQYKDILQYYRHNVSLGLVDSLKLAASVVLFAQPVRKLLRGMRRIIHK